ncbi:MAG: UDP-2,3-diacylglucosamine diphosphatase [Planctomycetota bacterium]
MNLTLDTAIGEPIVSHRCILAADLHCDGSSRRVAMFESLLRSCQDEGADCWLLGDLFDLWLGPGQIQLALTSREVAALRRATEAGVRIFVIPGNRDFLLDAAFEEETGVHVAGDHLLLETGKQRWHLSHGDLFSTADVGYLRMRRVLRSSWFLWLVRQLPLFAARGLARLLRKGSSEALQRKDASRMKPDLLAVRELLEQGFDRVVCGHYHVAQQERIEINERDGEFTVLEPFEDRGAHIFVTDGFVEMRYVESS